MERHYGLDWLRIGAFAILILYHVGMVFVPWNFHVKLPGADWVAVPMLASAPWRLALLFVVSGYASRALFARGGGTGRFVRDRSVRLLLPVAFAMIVVIPPQPWIELVTKYGYSGSLGHFWGHEYFRFGRLGGLDLPTWQHLWFVVYLWVYTMLVALVAIAAPGGARRAMQRGFDRVLGGAGALLIPAAWLLAVSAWLFPGARETHALAGDWVAHATYLPAFLFGFGLAGSPRARATFARRWRPAAAVALAAYAVVAAVALAWPGGSATPPPFGTLFSAARGVQGWAAIAALLGLADRFGNRDHRWRATLTEAVFPFYIIHQTIIVVVAYRLIPHALPMAANFAILVAATVAGCWAFYLAARAIPPLRPLVGLRRRRNAGPDAMPSIA